MRHIGGKMGPLTFKLNNMLFFYSIRGLRILRRIKSFSQWYMMICFLELEILVQMLSTDEGNGDPHTTKTRESYIEVFLFLLQKTMDYEWKNPEYLNLRND